MEKTTTKYRTIRIEEGKYRELEQARINRASADRKFLSMTRLLDGIVDDWLAWQARKS